MDDDIVFSAWGHAAVRKGGIGLANRYESKDGTLATVRTLGVGDSLVIAVGALVITLA